MSSLEATAPGEALLLFVATRLFESWASDTQRNVMLLSKATYLEFRPRITRVYTKRPGGLDQLQGLRELELDFDYRCTCQPSSADPAGFVCTCQPFAIGHHLEPLTRLTDLRRIKVIGEQNIDAVMDASYLTGFGALTSLREVLVCDVTFTNMPLLPPLPQLVSLDLRACRLADLDWLPKVPNLEALQLEGVFVSRIAPIRALTSLKRLDISCNGDVTDITPLGVMTSLQSLRIGRTPIASLQPLSALTGLKDLDASNTLVTDVQPLAALTSLETLELKETKVSDLSPLSGLQNLKQLGIGWSLVADLRPLTNLRGLERLVVGYEGASGAGCMALLADIMHYRLVAGSWVVQGT